MEKARKKVSSLRYALGILGLSLPSQLFTGFLAFYYVDTLNLAVGLAAIGRGIFAVWDAVDNLIFGYLSDNTRTKWGRRRPWMVGMLPIYMLLLILVFAVPEAFRTGNMLFVYFTVIIFLYETAATVLWQNYGALFPEIFKNKDKRANASAIKQVFAIIGMIVGLALTHEVKARFGFTTTAIIYAVIGGAIFLYSVLGSHEDQTLAKKEKLSFKSSFKVTLSNKTFWVYSLAYTLIQFVFGVLIAGLPFYTKYSLGLNGTQSMMMMAAVFVVAIPMVIIWSKFIKKWGAAKAWLIGAATLAITVIPLGFATNLVTGLIAGGILGLGYCGVLVTGEVVTSEIIDRDARKTGMRREAIYLSVYGFIIRISGLFQLLAFYILTLLFGYVSGDQPGPHPAEAFRFLMCVIPFVALVISFIIGIQYKKLADKDEAEISIEQIDHERSEEIV